MGHKLPFVVVTKPTGAACNLDCSYCFFLSKELLYPGSKQRMGDDQLEQYVRTYLAEQPDGPVTFVWQGGEPTLMGLEFFRRAVALAESHRRPAQDVSHSLQTNGVLISDEWAHSGGSRVAMPAATRGEDQYPLYGARGQRTPSP